MFYGLGSGFVILLFEAYWLDSWLFLTNIASLMPKLQNLLELVTFKRTLYGGEVWTV